MLKSATAAYLVLAATLASADTSAFTIVNDSTLNTAVANARTEWLARVPSTTMNRLNATILVPQANGTWRRGSFGQDTLSYAASTVKLAYLAAAMNWCRTNGRAYNSLESSVGPMIRVSDNVQTGVVVDTITGAPNIANLTSTTDSRWAAWYAKRRYTENYLSARGLLESMTVINKTYPSNNPLEGAEALCVNTVRGRNNMTPKLAASLMLEINRGAIEPGATAYMRDLLKHDRWTGYSPLGTGLPPGTQVENKIGNAYSDLNDITWIKLPNGQEAIIAAYSNGYEPNNPFPNDVSAMGPFAEYLIENAGLIAGNPAKVKIDNSSAAYSVTAGAWTAGTVARDKFGADYRYATGGTGAKSCRWNLAAPATGLYEVCVWYPQGTNRATNAPFTVNHAGGSTTVNVNQTYGGARWIRLGDFNLNAGSGSVVLTDAIGGDSSKIVVADAVKITAHPPAIIVDNAGAGFAASSNWSTATSATDKYGADYRFRSTAAVSDAAVFTYSVPSAGSYELFGWWSQGGNRSATAPFVCSTASGNQTVNRSQQSGGGSWQSLGTFSLNAGSNTISVSAWTTTGFIVMADAIKAERR